MTSCRFLRSGALYVKYYNGFGKAVADFLFVFHYNFFLSLTVKKLLSFSFWLDLPIQGEILGVLGAGDPQNLKCGDCNPQKAHSWVMPSLLSVYT